MNGTWTLPSPMGYVKLLRFVLADGLMWIMGHNGIEWAIHYLDDYFWETPHPNSVMMLSD